MSNVIRADLMDPPGVIEVPSPVGSILVEARFPCIDPRVTRRALLVPAPFALGCAPGMRRAALQVDRVA